MMMTRRRAILGTAVAAGGIYASAHVADKATTPPPKLKGKLLVDLHAHVGRYSDPNEVARAILRVGIVALTESVNACDYLSYEQMLSRFPSGEIEGGKMAKITVGSSIGYFIRAQELKVNFGNDSHIVALGCKKRLSYRWNYTPQDTVKQIHDDGGIAILAHPCIVPSTNWPLNYSVRDESQLKPVHKLLESTQRPDEIEVFNSQCILWMRKANEKARLLAKKYGYKGVSSSDTHSDLRQVGISGIYVSEEAVQKEGIPGLFNSIKSGAFERSEQHVSILGAMRTSFPKLSFLF